MKNHMRSLAVISFALTLPACEPEGTPATSLLSHSHDKALADTIAAVARATEASWPQVTCENLAPGLQYFDGSGTGMVYSYAHVMHTFSDSEWADSVRKAACARPAESAVDILLVSVLSRNVTAATMRNHTALRDSGGTPWHGLVLRVYRRTPDGWKVRVGMSSHIPVDSARW